MHYLRRMLTPELDVGCRPRWSRRRALELEVQLVGEGGREAGGDHRRRRADGRAPRAGTCPTTSACRTCCSARSCTTPGGRCCSCRPPRPNPFSRARTPGIVTPALARGRRGRARRSRTAWRRRRGAGTAGHPRRRAAAARSRCQALRTRSADAAPLTSCRSGAGAARGRAAGHARGTRGRASWPRGPRRQPRRAGTLANGYMPDDRPPRSGPCGRRERGGSAGRSSTSSSCSDRLLPPAADARGARGGRGGAVPAGALRGDLR